MKVWDIKEQPKTKYEDHSQWLNRMRSELVKHMGKKITVKEML